MRLGRYQTQGVGWLLRVTLPLCLVSCDGCGEARPQLTSPTLSHGVMSGEMDQRSAVVWGRGTGPGFLTVELQPPGARRASAPLDAARDFTARIYLGDLEPGTDYSYRAWVSLAPPSASDVAPEAAVGGRFRTAFDAQAVERVHFAFSGDLSGQNACRDADRGYPIFDAIAEDRLDFFIGLGDMIYADGVCDLRGRYFNQQVPRGNSAATKRSEFWEHWRYNREDAAFQRLLSGGGYYAVWDDHEVVNDFGPERDQRGNAPYRVAQHLMPAGLQAFLDYHGFPPRAEQERRLYRSRRWGKQVELFFLDTRQYRSVASLPGTDVKKSMLGAQQFEWLVEGLRKSDATWKFIVNSVPLAVPTGWPPEGPRDGWANFGGPTGFEVELTRLVAVLPELKPANVVFLTTDLHFAAAYTYRPFSGATAPGPNSEFSFTELVAGPLSAGLFPKLIFDESFGAERLFIHAPLTGKPVESLDEALGWFNYAVVDVDTSGQLEVSYRDGAGRVLYQLSLAPGVPAVVRSASGEPPIGASRQGTPAPRPSAN